MRLLSVILWAFIKGLYTTEGVTVELQLVVDDVGKVEKEIT